MAKDRIDKDSVDFNLGGVFQKLESIDETIKNLKESICWVSGIVAFCVSGCIGIIAIIVTVLKH